MHYYQFNIGDFHLHTSHLTLEEEAIYRRLLDFYYDTEKPIPKETQLVIRRLRLGSYEKTLALILEEFFTLEADGWHNYRADIELSEYKKKADIARENGKKGGRPKKNSGLETQPVILANPEETGSKAKHKPLTINQEPITKKHKPKVKAPAEPINYSEWPHEASPQVLQAWLTKRKQVKASLSQLAMNTVGKQLHIAASNGFTVDQCLCEAEAAGWKGFKAAWMANKQSTGYQTANEKAAARSAQTQKMDSPQDLEF